MRRIVHWLASEQARELCFWFAVAFLAAVIVSRSVI